MILLSRREITFYCNLLLSRREINYAPSNYMRIRYYSHLSIILTHTNYVTFDLYFLFILDILLFIFTYY